MFTMETMPRIVYSTNVKHGPCQGKDGVFLLIAEREPVDGPVLEMESQTFNQTFDSK